MKLELPGKINRSSWARFLGMDENDLVESEISGCEAELLEAASPQGFFVYHEMIDLPGNAIKKHLDGCARLVFMGLTLGRRVDELISRLSIKNVKNAVYVDTGASVLADMMADILEEQIRADLPYELPFMTPRFSPGYGDLPLDTQKILIKELDAERKIGLTLNDSDLMIPMKSVTAIMGIADHPVSGYLATCEECLLYDKCEKRKEGRICGKG